MNSKNTSRYSNLATGCEQVESTLHHSIVEHLNAEICLHTVTNMSQGIEWLQNTFLYIRAKKSPATYAVPSRPTSSGGQVRDRPAL
jgi:ATP-dependent DNA helicase HFM1/MER3